eukprot:6173204-Pleurochrysis_carterae.AAC.1
MPAQQPVSTAGKSQNIYKGRYVSTHLQPQWARALHSAIACARWRRPTACSQPQFLTARRALAGVAAAVRAAERARDITCADDIGAVDSRRLYQPRPAGWKRHAGLSLFRGKGVT